MNGVNTKQAHFHTMTYQTFQLYYLKIICILVQTILKTTTSDITYPPLILKPKTDITTINPPLRLPYPPRINLNVKKTPLKIQG